MELTMEVNLQIPEDIGKSLADDVSGLERALLEGLAVEGVRSGRISRGQARRLLGFRTRYEVDGFLKSHGVPIQDDVQSVLDDSESIRTMRAR